MPERHATCFTGAEVMSEARRFARRRAGDVGAFQNVQAGDDDRASDKYSVPQHA